MSSFETPLWKQAPFLQLLCALTAGIAFGWFVVLFPVFRPLYAAGIFIGVALALHYLFRLLGGRLHKYAGIKMGILLFLFGILLSYWNREDLRPDFAGRFLTDSSFIKVKLEEPLTEKAHSWKAKAEILSVANGDQIHEARGQVLLYFHKKGSKGSLRYGDVLLIPNRLEKIKSSGNPGAFDYNRYCRTKNIYFSAYLPEGQWHVLQHRQGSGLKAFFLNSRAACVQILEQYISSSREAGVAEALLLGYRGNLEPELVQAYASVGVVHLIAISGLHIGLIYLILAWLFHFLPDKKGLKEMKGLLIFLCLWSFTLLTGAHPSTLRATIMLSFLILGKFVFRRSANTLNTLAASAFVLLSVNPFLLFDVGFQLSYLAVAGILIFQRPIDNLFFFKNRACRYVWKMMSVSLAAQLLTFPLVLFYFHQFPNFFLLSNLLLIPAASFALYIEVALLSLSFIPLIGKILGFAVTKWLIFMNAGILWANGFPYIRLDHIGLNLLELFLIYGFIVMLSIWLFYKNKKAFVSAIALITIFCLITFVQQWQFNIRKKVIVYQVSGHSAIEFVRGKKSRFLADTPIWNDPAIQKYTLTPAMVKLNITHRSCTSMEQFEKSFFEISNKRIAVIQQSFHPDLLKGAFPVDYVVLSGSNRLEMREVKRHFSPGYVILDASVPKWQREKWKTACKQLNLHCFSVPDKGAWILSLK